MSASVDPSVVNVQSAQLNVYTAVSFGCVLELVTVLFFPFLCFSVYCHPQLAGGADHFYSFILLSLVCKVGGAEEVWEQMEVPVVFEPPCISIGQFLVWTNGDWSYEMIHDSTRNYTFR